MIINATSMFVFIFTFFPTNEYLKKNNFKIKINLQFDNIQQ